MKKRTGTVGPSGCRIEAAGSVGALQRLVFGLGEHDSLHLGLWGSVDRLELLLDAGGLIGIHPSTSKRKWPSQPVTGSTPIRSFSVRRNWPAASALLDLRAEALPIDEDLRGVEVALFSTEVEWRIECLWERVDHRLTLSWIDVLDTTASESGRVLLHVERGDFSDPSTAGSRILSGFKQGIGWLGATLGLKKNLERSL
jgi:hypothetical protein